MNYRTAIRLIKSDFLKYKKITCGRSGNLRAFFWMCITQRGFWYQIWLRLAAVNGIALPICWYMHHRLSTKFCIQISRRQIIGESFYIGHGTCCVINPTSRIGNNVSLHQFTSIVSNKGGGAIIEDNVSIYANVVVIENVKIGQGSIVGAGSVVTKDVPPKSIVVGNPAKVIKRINT